MGTTPYEVKFEVRDITSLDDPRIQVAENELDAFVVLTQDNCTVAIEVDDVPNGIAAGKTAAHALSRAGIVPIRSVPDIVDTSAIASRAEVTRQAVDHWVRGARGEGFPDTFWPAGPRVWLWREVNDWLKENSKAFDADVEYPTKCDHTMLDAYLLSEYVMPSRQGSVWNNSRNYRTITTSDPHTKFIRTVQKHILATTTKDIFVATSSTKISDIVKSGQSVARFQEAVLHDFATLDGRRSLQS